MALPVIWKQTTKCLNFSFEREMFSRRATSQANQADDTRRSIKVWVLRGGDDFPGKPAFNNGCKGMSCASTKYLCIDQVFIAQRQFKFPIGMQSLRINYYQIWLQYLQNRAEGRFQLQIRSLPLFILDWKTL